MPVVQRYGNQKIETAAYPGVRKTAAETDLSTGVGLAQAKGASSIRKLEGLGRIGAAGEQIVNVLGQQAIDMRREETHRADELAVLHAENQLSSWENQRIYNPNGGALTVKGKDSFGLPEQVGEEYTKVSTDIASGLSTDRQRIAFAKVQAGRGQQLDLTLRRHVYGEMQRYEGEELQALVSNAKNAAIANATDPRRVGVELNRAVDAITTHAPRLGMGPEQVKEEIDKTRTATHTGVIESLLAQDQTKSAQVYFEETKSQITGESVVRIEKALNAGKVRSQAQKQADVIVASGGTLTEQREKARAIEDPDVRDAVMQRVEHEAAVSEKATRDAEQARLTRAYLIVDQTHDVTKIPPAEYAQLADHLPALRSYAEHLTKGIPIETDLPTYYHLMQQAAHEPETFATANLLAYRAKLGETEFKQLTELQLSIVKSDSKAPQQLEGFRTKKELVDGSLEQYGIDPRSKDPAIQKAIVQLYRMLDRRVDAAQAPDEKGHARKVTNTEMQETIDGILGVSKTTPGSWWSLLPFSGATWKDKTQRLIDLAPADIPAAERTQIEDALRRQHLPVTDQTVLDLYLEGMIRRGSSRRQGRP